MDKLSVCLLFLQLSVLVLAADKTSSVQQSVRPTQNPDDDDDIEAMEGLGWCKNDQDLAAICIACAQLPGTLALPPSECCSNADALEKCKNCVDNPVRCFQDEFGLSLDSGSIRNGEFPMYDQRYGMLENTPIYTPLDSEYGDDTGSFNPHEPGQGDRSSNVDKRWGSLGLSKRFGTLNLGSYFAKRYGMLNLGNPYLGYLGRGYGSVNLGKRFGTFNLGNSRYRFGIPDKKWGTLNLGKKRELPPESELAKRYGTLNLGKRYGTLNMDKRFGTLNLGKRFGTLNLGKRLGTLNLGKRYGTLNMGSGYGLAYPDKRYGTLNLGKRYGTLNLGKRYGTLNMGNKYGYYPYKRSEYVPYNGDIGTDMKKRYGRLFMGPFAGKRSAEKEEEIRRR